MKRKIATLIAGILLVGIVTAGLVPWLSNIVSGSVEVRGPVFYATIRAGENGSLSINEPGNGTTYTISGQDEKIFKTNKVDTIDFYAPELNLSVEAKLNEGSPPKMLDLEFGYYDKYIDGSSHPFCSVTINVTSTENYKIYSDICKGSSTNQLEGFYYSIKGRGSGDVKIKVKTTAQNTKAEVLGIAE